MFLSKSGLLVSLSVSCLLACSGQEPPQCDIQTVHYEPIEVDLRGVPRIMDFTVELPDGSIGTVSVPVFILHCPIMVLADEGQLNSDTVAEVQMVQLWGDEEDIEIVSGLIGTELTITGSLSEWQTAHHFTKVLLHVHAVSAEQ